LDVAGCTPSSDAELVGRGGFLLVLDGKVAFQLVTLSVSGLGRGPHRQTVLAEPGHLHTTSGMLLTK